MKRFRKRSRDHFFKFGKAPAKRDNRNLMLASILRAPVTLPREYDFDVQHHGIPTPMFGNDVYSDCVMAGRAHQTLRFEDVEQGVIINVSDKDVLREYMKETGGADSGLILLDSLKLWRSRGWIAAKRNYKIKVFAQVDQQNSTEIKRTIFSDIGVGLGLLLSQSAIDQFHAGKAWAVVTGPYGKPNRRMGHYVYVPGYTTSGPVCVTWGRKQQMTWDFLAKHCDEAYAIIDAVDTPKKKRAFNEMKIRTFLRNLKKKDGKQSQRAR